MIAKLHSSVESVVTSYYVSISRRGSYEIVVRGFDEPEIPTGWAYLAGSNDQTERKPSLLKHTLYTSPSLFNIPSNSPSQHDIRVTLDKDLTKECQFREF